MGVRRSRYAREDIRVTKEWYQTECAPRIQERDRKVLQFIADNRIVTSDQVARAFWEGRQNKANRRLRILYDLHCIDRFYPLVKKGSAKQHIILDRAGARVLGLEHWKKSTSATAYRHNVLVAEYRLCAYQAGWPWGETEYDLGPVIADIWYPESRMAVEIDTGTEGLEALRQKAARYRMLTGINWIVMVTSGAQERIRLFLEGVIGASRHRAGGHIREMKPLLEGIKQKGGIRAYERITHTVR